ncbi:pseudaminic acid cytidylyltransferase [Alphaproteobacteria bacterium]|nr:pseudaminic acid cytidylyltransferase [Alphaproteobacteria bacterium]
MYKKNLAIIPARRNSKRIPQKNIKIFDGRPIIEYVIQTCIKSKIFDDVIVSTDCSEISKISKNAGASVPFIRDANLSDDFTPTINVVKHAIKFFKKKDINFHSICCVYATAPFLTSEVLFQGLKKLQSHNCNFVFAAGVFSSSVLRAIDEDGSMLFPKHKLSRSQDLKSYYYDAGQFYWGTIEAFERNSSILGNKALPLQVDQRLAIDIDTIDDWHDAETLWKAKNR